MTNAYVRPLGFYDSSLHSEFCITCVLKRCRSVLLSVSVLVYVCYSGLLLLLYLPKCVTLIQPWYLHVEEQFWPVPCQGKCALGLRSGSFCSTCSLPGFHDVLLFSPQLGSYHMLEAVSKHSSKLIWSIYSKLLHYSTFQLVFNCTFERSFLKRFSSF